MQKLSYPDPHHDLTSNTLFGFWVYLLTDTVMFASFFATYAVLQVHAEKLPFNMSFALLATCTLLLSSFSIGIAMVKAAQDKNCSFFLWLDRSSRSSSSHRPVFYDRLYSTSSSKGLSGFCLETTELLEALLAL